MATKLHASLIVTYRCNARCNMCDVWRYSSKNSKELDIGIIRKLPNMFFANVTGGEPFVRQDLPDFIGELKKKARRIVISTNGFFTDRIINLCNKYPQTGIRISIEGLREENDKIRGIPNGYLRTQNTLRRLNEMNIKDIGFAMTIQDINYMNILPLYRIAKSSNYEFATAAVHNSHYFHKWDNKIKNKEEIVSQINLLIDEQLKSKKPKEWFRAYFNFGLINYIKGNPRLLPCEMGNNGFFIDPEGDVLACNGMDKKAPLGNINQNSWNEIWNSDKAHKIRNTVKKCNKNCWMIGSAAPAILHHPIKPLLWVSKNKIKSLINNDTNITKFF